MNPNEIAETLADARILESTHPRDAQNKNDALDDLIVAFANRLNLSRRCCAVFYARAHFARGPVAQMEIED